jgi:hypothetical protein
MLSVMLVQTPDDAIRQVVEYIYAESQAKGLSFTADEQKILSERPETPLPESWLENFEEQQNWESFSQKVVACLTSAQAGVQRREGRAGKRAFRNKLELAAKTGTYLGGTIAVEMLGSGSVVTQWRTMAIATVFGSIVFITAIFAWINFMSTAAGEHFQEVVVGVTQRATIPFLIAGAITLGVWWLRWQRHR